MKKILTKVDKPTDWVSSLAIVEKPNGNLRLCLDPKDLNNNIKREHYHISGFWQIELDQESAELCTFNTPFGRYFFNRLPFGIHSASEVFHKYMTEMLENVQGAISYIDDILVYGKTKDEHDVRLRQVL